MHVFRLRTSCRILVMLMLLFSAVPYLLVAQVMTVSGVVTDAADGRALSGVSVSLKGTKKGTVTDDKGRFSLQANRRDVLIFSFKGLETQELLVSGSSVSITLKPAAASMDDIVVVGYSSVKKTDLTGSVSQVNVKDITKAPVASFADALAGRVAGVQAASSDGQPGSTVNITIRGAGSLTQSTAPLYVVDGFPVENFDPNTLNSEEIESINILKDASSTSIYGSRAANGVIVIQTKRGKSGRPVVSFSSSLGFQTELRKMELMDAYEFVKYQQELNPTAVTTQAYFAGGKKLDDYRSIEGLDLQDYVLRKGRTGIYNLSVRGGNEQTKYSVSGSLFKQDGVVIATGLNRYNGRVTLDQIISNRVKAGISANYSGILQNGPSINSGTTSAITPTSYIFSRTWMYRPITVNPDQDLLNDDFDSEAVSAADIRVNPYIDLQNQYQKDFTNLFDANAYISFDITKELVFKSTAGIRNNEFRAEKFFNSRTAQGGPNPGNTNGVNGSIRNVLTNSFFNSNTLTYNKTFNKDHKFSALGLFEVNRTGTGINAYAGRFLPNESLGIDGIDEGIAYNPVSSNSENSMVSYAGRIDYSFRSKYLITGTFRADASSKFSPQNRWGYFPGAALAWNIHKENFFKGLTKILSTSKVRFSYGSNGNNRVGDFDTYSRLRQDIDGYSFNNGTPLGAVVMSSVANPDLTWEKVNTTDLGIELGFLRDRIMLEVDLYKRNTTNLLLNAALPATSGFSSAIKNIGALENKGLEVTINTLNVSNKKFSWRTTANISFNQNKIVQLANGQESLATNVSYVSQFNRPLYIAQVGRPSGMMLGYLWLGNYQFDDFDNPAPGVYILKPNVPTNGNTRSTIQPGDIKYKDMNGDGVVNDFDMTIIGRGQPIHTGGVNNNFTYGNWSLNVFFQWSYGNNIYNANRLLMEGNSNGFSNTNQFKTYANRWTPENPNNLYFRTRGQGPIGYHSSRVVEDGSYLRLKTLSLGYSLSSSLIRKLQLSNLTLNIAAQNLLTWTNYSGMDPEVSTRNNVLSPGYDFSSYPQARTIVFGLKADF